jgi:hypothetical protein
MFVLNDASWFEIRTHQQPVKKEDEKFCSPATGYASKKAADLLHQTLDGRNVGPG